MPNIQTTLKLALELHKKGDLLAAEMHYCQVLAAEPNNYTALSNVGTIYLIQQRWQQAEQSLKWASQINASNPELFYKLGFSLQQQGKLEEAILTYQQTLEKQENYPGIYSQLGMAYHQQGKHEAAIAAFQAYIKLQPHSAEGYYNLGYTLHTNDQFEKAVSLYQQALKLQPHYYAAHTNLAIVFRKLGKLPEALQSFQTALSLQSDDATAYYNYGLTLYEAEHFEESVCAYQKAIQLRPDYPEARFSLSIALLLLGRYHTGFQEYEWRFKANPEYYKFPNFQQWTGLSANTNELVIINEQGIGDLIQFMRYGLAVRDSIPVVSIAAHTKFYALLKLSGIFHKIYPLPVDESSMPTGAQWVSLLSLPGKLGASPDNPVVTHAYLKSDPGQDQRWQSKIKSHNAFIVGLNWQGNPEIEKNEFRGRSFSLSEYEPLSSIPGIQFASLQKGYGSEQLDNCTFKGKFVTCQNEINETWDLVETLAIIQSCDLIITSDTSIAHLAGALGKPTWILLKKVPEWRWGLAGEECSWYPSARLFRQSEAGNWGKVMAQVQEALELLLSKPSLLPYS